MSRSFGSIALDDNVNTFADKSGLFVINNAKQVNADQMIGRFGRESWVKDDAQPLNITVVGLWADGGGKYWRDFAGALLGQPRTMLTLGDGTRYEWVDITEVSRKRVGGAAAGTSTPAELWAYSAKAMSYEPYARDVSPSLVTLGACTTGNGTNNTTFTVNYGGSAFAEPTWQFTIVIPAATTVSQVKLANAQTGETCTWTGTLNASSTYYLQMDASGGVVGQTPSNNQYGVLNNSTTGRGVTLYQASATQVDFTGQMPTLVPGGTMTIPPTAFANQITATITATGALTTCSLAYIAPNRWYR